MKPAPDFFLSFELAIIVLSAGSSARLPAHKALLRIGNSTAVRCVVQTALSSRSSRNIIVLGARSEEIGAQLSGLPVETVYNRNYASGRTGSLKSALRYLGDDLDRVAVMVFPVDCPFVPHALLDMLMDCCAQARTAAGKSLWVVPAFRGRRGHPIVLAGPILARVLSLDDDYPLRDFLNGAKDEGSLLQLEVLVDNEAVLDNINSKEDVRRLWKREGLACVLPS